LVSHYSLNLKNNKNYSNNFLEKEVIDLNRKILGLCIVFMLIAVLATPIVSAKPWEYPKNNDKFEQFGVTYNFDWSNYMAAAAGLEWAKKVVITFEEQPTSLYQVRIGEDGPGQRVYNQWDPISETGDFQYSGVATLTVWDPVLPWVFDPTDVIGTFFVQGSKQHFRVDYTYDFSAVPGGLEGTLTFVAIVSGNSLVLGGDKAMHIFSTIGRGDFINVNVQATAGPDATHMGIVSGWPE
jgi:hypothetical protein